MTHTSELIDQIERTYNIDISPPFVDYDTFSRAIGIAYMMGQKMTLSLANPSTEPDPGSIDDRHVTPRDWACIKLKQANECLGSPEASEMLADAKKFELCARQLDKLTHTLNGQTNPNG